MLYRNRRSVSPIMGRLRRCVLLAAPLGCQATERSAEGVDPADYPSRSIEIVTWATQGGGSDLLARALVRTGERHFGQPMRVVTRQGGAGATAMQYLAGHEGDPHVLGVFTSSGAVNMATGRIPFSPEDFTYLLRVQLDPFLIAVRTESRFDDLRGLLSFARDNPGELSISGFGAASAHFLGFSRLLGSAGSPEMRWIAYGGSGEAMIAALGGHTDAVHSNYNIVREHLRAGTMKVLGVAEPLAALPEARTYEQQGFDVAPVHWRGVVAPDGLAPELAARVRELLLVTVRDPEFVAFMEEAAMQEAVMTDPAAFAVWVAGEVAQNERQLRALDLLERDRP